MEQREPYITQRPPTPALDLVLVLVSCGALADEDVVPTTEALAEQWLMACGLNVAGWAMERRNARLRERVAKIREVEEEQR